MNFARRAIRRAALPVLALLLATAAHAGELRVMTSGGFTAAYLELGPAFERTTQEHVVTVTTTMGTGADSIPSRLQRGEQVDVVIVADAALNDLVRSGLVMAGSRVPLARSAIAMAVRAGAAKPDISTVDGLKRALLNASSIAYSASVSGDYLSTELFERLGIADQMKSKSHRIERERVGAVVARGEAELGFQQVSELLPVPGIDLVGPLPAEVQRVTVFSAGIASRSINQAMARRFIQFLASPGAQPVVTKTGLETVGADLVTYRVRPSDTDPAIARFNFPHYVVFDPAAPPSADLLLFMPGTGGNPNNVSEFLHVAARQGYRAVGLEYNDVPAVVGVCPRDPDPACSAKVRQKRIFGEDVTPRIDDTAAESIVNRLSKLLIRLDRDHPADGWGAYLENGRPKWERIAVGGHSQGAGMAAFIAQRQRVARVVLFSSPWDFSGGREQRLAPWILSGHGATPADRWFGAYHKSENTAALIASSYRALGVAGGHTRVLALEPGRTVGDNPYHLSVVGNMATPHDAAGLPSYADDWRFLLGVSR